MKTYVNLLPANVLRKQLLYDRVVLWSVVWLFGFGAIGIHNWRQACWLETATLLERRGKVQHQQLQKLEKETREAKQTIDELQRSEALTLDLASDVSPTVVLGVVSRAARTSEDKINVRRFFMEQRGHGKSASVSDRILEIEGFGNDNLAVARFVATLRDAQLFDRIELKESKESKVGGGTSIRSYAVEGAF
jgi:hypothetical protein